MKEKAAVFLKVCLLYGLGPGTVGIEGRGPQDDVLAVKRAIGGWRTLSEYHLSTLDWAGGRPSGAIKFLLLLTKLGAALFAQQVRRVRWTSR
jgi:hypothetical protein